MEPWCSVLVPTRNRPATLAGALASVLEQRCVSFEVIIVDDGSTPPARETVMPRSLAEDSRVRWIELAHRPAGHGAPFARNTGAAAARGRYLAMLDDDDLWTDPCHLKHASDVLAQAEARGSPAELYFADQHAFLGDALVETPLWLDGLDGRLRAAGRRPVVEDTYEVTVDDLLKYGGFCHLNTTIFRREFYEALGGMDETLRYEPDRDIYLRAIDQARHILYRPAIIARHNVPNPHQKRNVSTALAPMHKRLHQLRLLGKASIDAKQDKIRRFALVHRGYTLKRLSEEMAAVGRYREASIFAREAMSVLPTVKWLLYTLYLHWRGLGR